MSDREPPEGAGREPDREPDREPPSNGSARPDRSRSQHIDRGNGRGPLTPRGSNLERPLFGVSSSGRWVVLVAVTSALTGLLLLAGGTIGALAGRGPVPLWIGAAAGGVLGVTAGVWLGLRMADIQRSRGLVIAATAGGVLGLAVGVLLPAVLGRAPIPGWPVIAMVAPGAGAAIGAAVWWRLRRP